LRKLEDSGWIRLGYKHLVLLKPLPTHALDGSA
jgi:hypothetical protein